jgi:hypothetical protein
VTKGQRAHVGRVLDAHTGIIKSKYRAGQKEHGGNCWEKPGMLAHAMDEAADLPVYLHTLWEQIQEIAVDLENGLPGEDGAARLYRLMQK